MLSHHPHELSLAFPRRGPLGGIEVPAVSHQTAECFHLTQQGIVSKYWKVSSDDLQYDAHFVAIGLSTKWKVSSDGLGRTNTIKSAKDVSLAM